MKAKYIFFFLIGMLVALSTYGQNNTKKVETIEFQVQGLCGMCKERIENAATIKGVKLAEWNKETSILKVIYNPAKVKPDDIHKAIAEAGHDTDKVKATDKAYAELPGCCAYRDNNKEKH